MCETTVVITDSRHEVGLRVDEYGSGRPILLLHGRDGFPQRFRASPRRTRGSPRPRAHAPRFRGDGPSSRNGDGPRAGVALRPSAGKDFSRRGHGRRTSMGGWIAAELALAEGARLERTVLVDAIGIDVPGHPVVDIFSLSPRERAEVSYHDPVSFPAGPSELNEEQRAVISGNVAAFKTYSNFPAMTDPTLRQRLRALSLPTLLVWEESGKVVTPEYGRAYSDSIPNAVYTVLPAAGHYPQLERPEDLAGLIAEFIGA